VAKCSKMRAFGIGFMNWMNLQTVPPDIFYNPSRIMWVGMDLAEGLFTYFNEGWNNEDQAPEAFFDRLVELRIDPVIVFKALDAGQQFMFIAASILGKFDPVGLVTGVLDTVHPEAAEHFARGNNASSHVYTTLKKHFKHANVTKTIIGVINETVTPLYPFTKLVFEANRNQTNNRNKTATGLKDMDDDAYIDYNDGNVTDIAPYFLADEVGPNITDVAVWLDQVLDPTAATRRALLMVTTGCLLLDTLESRLVEIGNTLGKYYGSKDGYLYHTLCAYDVFLRDVFMSDTEKPDDFAGGCPREGQTKFKSEWATLSTDVPGIKQLTGGAEGGGSLFSPAYIEKSVKDFFVKPDERRTRDIVGVTKTWVMSPVACDPDMLLCKWKTRSLLSSIWITEVWLFIILVAATLTGLPVAAVFFTAQLLVVPVVVLYLTYGFPFTCLPSVPVCIGDDVFDLILLFFPRHLTWPVHVVPYPHRGTLREFTWFQTLDSEIVDCKTVDVNGLYDVFYWSRQYLRELGFIEYDWFWQVVEWPLLRFSPGTREARKRWRLVTLSPLVNECAALNILSIFPPLIVSFFFYLVVSFAAMPLLRLAATVYVQSHPLIRKFVSLALDIYNT